MSYSEALEQQLVALRWLSSPEGTQFIARADEISKKNGDTYEWKPDLVARRMELPLARGDTFYLSRDMSTLIEASSKSLTDSVLLEEMMPSRLGFCFFEKGMALQSAQDISLDALTWVLGLRSRGRPDDAVLAVFLTTWTLRQGHLVPIGGESWDVGSTMASEIAFSENIGGPAVIAHQVLRFFGSFLLFLQQKILSTSIFPVDRYARKRIEQTGFVHEPLVRVVHLRRKASCHRPSDDHEAIEWSHQWVVSGHWRAQPYPSLGIVQPKWIMPYVKGPEDKPLKPPRAKVFAVVR